MENDGRTYVVTGSGLVDCTLDGQSLASLLKASAGSNYFVTIREVEVPQPAVEKPAAATDWIKTQDRMPEMRRAWPGDLSKSESVLISLKTTRDGYALHIAELVEDCEVKGSPDSLRNQNRNQNERKVKFGWRGQNGQTYSLFDVFYWMPLPDAPAAP